MSNLAIVGEAWGEEEARQRAPFVGPTGYELNRLLAEAGIRRADCFITNVINQHPPGNRLEEFCGSKEEGIPGFPALDKGKYLRAEFRPELERLANELTEANPNLILALGATAAWALLGRSGISKLRGTTDISTHTVAGFKVLPTFHPAAIFRQWEFRPIVVVDLIKAKRESAYPEIRRPKREIWIEPTLEDIRNFHRAHVEGCEILSIDIETAGRQITCVGLAPTGSIGLVIPFTDYRKSRRSYWPTHEDESKAWAYVRTVLAGPWKKVFQNGLYDIAFLWRAYGLKTYNAEHDTMLLHHALQPESVKDLGFLGSIYTDESAWKGMRWKKTTIKRDD